MRTAEVLLHPEMSAPADVGEQFDPSGITLDRAGQTKIGAQSANMTSGILVT